MIWFDKIFWLIPVIFSLLALFLVVMGVGAFLQRCWLTVFGEHAIGTVVGFVLDEQSPTSVTEMDLLSSRPFLRIAFTDYFGQSHEVTNASGVSPKKFRPGDQVPLLYRNGHPESFVVNRFWMKWSVPVGFIGFGLVLLIPGFFWMGTLWPAFGNWIAHIGRQMVPVLAPIVTLVLPTLFVSRP